jgi:hypothetical protein
MIQCSHDGDDNLLNVFHTADPEPFSSNIFALMIIFLALLFQMVSLAMSDTKTPFTFCFAPLFVSDPVKEK